MARTFASDRSWRFDADRADLWDRLIDVGRYPEWWPWLRRFRPDGGFAADARWHCVVAPPLPYVVRFTIVLQDVDPQRRAEATVHGDITGSAVLTVDEHPDGGSTARLRSRLAPTDPVLRRVALVAPPLVRWGHDWVLDQGRRQFVERATSD